MKRKYILVKFSILFFGVNLYQTYDIIKPEDRNIKKHLIRDAIKKNKN